MRVFVFLAGKTEVLAVSPGVLCSTTAPLPWLDSMALALHADFFLSTRYTRFSFFSFECKTRMGVMSATSNKISLLFRGAVYAYARR